MSGSISQCPPEILGQIFTLCRPCVGHEFHHHNSLDTSQVPWNLSHVCTKWRVTALSHPELWRIVKLNFAGSGTRARAEGMESLLKVQLERAGVPPLDVTMYFDDDTDSHAPLFKTVLPAILLTSERWSRLDISSLPYWAIPELNPIRGRVPSLRTLLVGEYGDAPDISPIFEQAPKLRALNASPGSSYHPLPWAQLTEFYHPANVHASPESCVATLIACPGLEVCNLSITGTPMSWGTVANLPPCQSNLRNLTVRITSMLPYVLSLFIGSLTLPKLEYLGVIATGGVGIWAESLMQPIDALFARSKCKLKHLSLSPPGLLTRKTVNGVVPPPTRNFTIPVLSSVGRCTLVDGEFSDVKLGGVSEYLQSVCETSLPLSPPPIPIPTSQIKNLIFHLTTSRDTRKPKFSMNVDEILVRPALRLQGEDKNSELVASLEELSAQGLRIELVQ